MRGDRVEIVIDAGPEVRTYDIVATRTVLLVLGAATKSYYDWAGLTAHPANKFSMNFNGDGGRYRVWCSLSVYA